MPPFRTVLCQTATCEYAGHRRPRSIRHTGSTLCHACDIRCPRSARSSQWLQCLLRERKGVPGSRCAVVPGLLYCRAVHRRIHAHYDRYIVMPYTVDDLPISTEQVQVERTLRGSALHRVLATVVNHDELRAAAWGGRGCAGGSKVGDAVDGSEFSSACGEGMRRYMMSDIRPPGTSQDIHEGEERRCPMEYVPLGELAIRRSREAASSSVRPHSVVRHSRAHCDES